MYGLMFRTQINIIFLPLTCLLYTSCWSYQSTEAKSLVRSVKCNMEVSKDGGTPKSSSWFNFNRIFHCKPSIVGYPISRTIYMLNESEKVSWRSVHGWQTLPILFCLSCGVSPCRFLPRAGSIFQEPELANKFLSFSSLGSTCRVNGALEKCMDRW